MHLYLRQQNLTPRAAREFQIVPLWRMFENIIYDDENARVARDFDKIACDGRNISFTHGQFKVGLFLHECE